MTFVAWVVPALQLLALAPSQVVPSPQVEREAWVMGTRLRIAIEGTGGGDAQALGETILREVERVDDLLSTWDEATPLSRLNRTPPGRWTQIAPELSELLEEARAWADRTGGAFEHRVGALVDVWDLRGQGGTPTADEVALALASTGADGIRFENGLLRRLSEDAWIDAGGFGKGAALRAAAARLRAETLSDFRVLVDLGGQILALAPADVPWEVDVAHPLHRTESVAVLSVYDRSVSTTGTSERGRHVVDPRTGRPVDAWGSVTVVAADALVADVLSTALYVMGPHEGLAWAEGAGIAALFLDGRGGDVSATWTSRLEPWLLHAPSSL